MRKLVLIGVGAALAAASFGAGLVARGDSETSDAASGPGVSPQTFERVASGVALIGIRDCAGKPILGPDGNEGSGTGFLIGSRVLMTAEHVVLGATSHPRACGMRARLGNRWYDVEEATAWRDRGQKDWQAADTATLTLATDVPGHVFALADGESRVGSAVAALGYPRGLPLSFTQGFVNKKLEDRDTPMIAANMGIEGGNSGGPIIDRSGNVVTVVSRIVVWASGTAGDHYYGGPDFARWWGESARSDLCRAHPDAGIPDCPSSPAAADKSPLELHLRKN